MLKPTLDYSYFGCRKKTYSSTAVNSFHWQSVRVIGSFHRKRIVWPLPGFGKAFENMPHENLSQKNFNISERGKIRQLLQNFVSEPTQVVIKNSLLLKLQSVTIGAPNSSFLGIMLFIVFANGLSVSLAHIASYRLCDKMEFVSADNGNVKKDAHCFENQCEFNKGVSIGTNANCSLDQSCSINHS